MLRSGIPEDAEAIESIRVAAWKTAYSRFMPERFLSELDARKSVESLARRLSLSDKDFSITVAEHNEEVVGFCIVGKPRFETNSNVIELWALNVHPNFWRKSYGAKMTAHVLSSAKRSGFDAIELWCIKGNTPAESAYMQAGFLNTGRERTSSTLTGNPIHEQHFAKNL